MKINDTKAKIQVAKVPSIGLPFLTAAILLLLANGTAIANQERESKQRPNVVVLFADDLGSKDIGCYGGPVKTPALDGLAAEGVRFTDFHSGCSVCSPSRAVLLTGRQHIRTGVYHVVDDNSHDAHLLESEVTLAEVLKGAGYSTAHFGKWHLGLPYRGRDKPTLDEHGFDYWFATENNASPSHKNPVNFIRNGTPVGKIEGYASHIVVDDAIAWLDERRDPNVPFFFNIWLHEPHAITAAPDEIVSQYGDLDDPGAIYSGTIDNTDRAIARLLAKLKEVDAPENTIIVYSSDHGSYRYDRNGILRGTKGSNFEGGTRAPGIFYWPGTIMKGHLEAEPAGMVDLLPTVCGLVGIDKPAGVHLDGSDLSALLTNRKNEFTRHQPLFWLLPTQPRDEPAIAIRDGKYAMVAYRDYDVPQETEKMEGLLRQIREMLPDMDPRDFGFPTLRKQTFNSRFANKEADRLRSQYVQLNSFQERWIPIVKAGGYEKFELYDLSTDPGQKTDISAQHPDITASLKKQLLELNASVMADGPDWN